MSTNPQNGAESESGGKTPKYIISYSAMVTILLAFFIMLNNLATVREYGLVGTGLGVFRESFNSFGLSGILPGSRSPTGLTAAGGKFIPEDVPRDPHGRPMDDRLIDPDEHDIEDAVTALLKTDQDVILPLPIRRAERLDKQAKERLAFLAKLIRLSRCDVHVCATIVVETASLQDGWREATAWALQVGEYLCSEEGIPPDRVLVVGKALSRSPDDSGRDEAIEPVTRAAQRRVASQSSIGLILRPRRRAAPAVQPPKKAEWDVPLMRKPKTIRRIVK